MTASVVSAAILEGNLIIGLSDGSVINCGYVQGPQGLKGDPGPMGADGDAGRDGNTIITVAGTPRNDAGKDGDYAIDNVNWRIYGPKSGGTWGKANDMLPSKDNLITNGLAPSSGGGSIGGGESAGGIDYPPVIFSEDPPTIGGNNGPIRQGDLWFDSEQLALYVAVTNTANKIVWMISTPSNRQGLVSEIPKTRGQRPLFEFPANKEIAYNPNTETEYIYNAPKKQWIDLSQMVHYGNEPPCHAPKGAIFTHEDTLKQFVHQGNCVWVEQTSCGAGGGSINEKLTAVKFTAYQVRKYFDGILTEVFWETQVGIHFEDETTVEVDMNNNGTWEDVHQMNQTTLDNYGILEVFTPESGAVNFVFDEGSNPLGPYPVQPNFACAQLRVTVKNKNLKDPEDFTIMSSEPTFIYPEYTQDPSPNPAPAHPGANC